MARVLFLAVVAALTLFGLILAGYGVGGAVVARVLRALRALRGVLLFLAVVAALTLFGLILSALWGP